jgi:hypothetical protein
MNPFKYAIPRIIKVHKLLKQFKFINRTGSTGPIYELFKCTDPGTGCSISTHEPVQVHQYRNCSSISTYCDVDGSTESRSHVNPAVSRVTSRTPTRIITHRSVNTPSPRCFSMPCRVEPKWAEVSRAEARWLPRSSKQLLAALPNNTGKHDVRQQGSPWNDCC